jgi:hypothetical protein
MEVVLVKSDAFKALTSKIDKIHNLILRSNQAGKTNALIDNNEFCKQLKISKRTAQNYRDKKLISFIQIGSKIHYKPADVEAFLQKHHIKSRD